MTHDGDLAGAVARDGRLDCGQHICGSPTREQDKNSFSVLFLDMREEGSSRCLRLCEAFVDLNRRADPGKQGRIERGHRDVSVGKERLAAEKESRCQQVRGLR